MLVMRRSHLCLIVDLRTRRGAGPRRAHEDAPIDADRKSLLHSASAWFTALREGLRIIYGQDDKRTGE